MRLRALAALLAVALAFAGCGSKSHGPASNGEASKTAAQIVADATAAAVAASAVHVTGSGVTGGQPLALDLQLVAGQGGQGSLTVSGLSFDIVRIGPKAYFKGDPAFWRHFGGSAAAQLFKGKWLMAPATTGDLASFTPLTDLAAVMKQTLGSHGTIKNTGTTTIQGQSVVGVLDPAKGATLYVAATGTPYPVQLTSKNKGVINFDSWNEAVTLNAPKNPIDYSKLKQ